MKFKKQNEFGGFWPNASIQTILIIWGLLQVLPLIWLIYNSFKPSADIYNDLLAFPKTLYLENYNFKALTASSVFILSYLKNSFFITLFSLIILLITSYISGYAIAKLKFRGKSFVIIFLIALLGVPLYSVIIPLYHFIADLGLLNRYVGLIFPYVAFHSPFTILMIQAYFRKFPDEIIEAAKIDGCNTVSAFFRIVLPMSSGIAATVLILNFMSIWNEFLISFILMKNNLSRTLPVGVAALKGEYKIEWGPLFASMVLALVPVIVVYLIFHRFIIKGVTSGAIKG